MKRWQWRLGAVLAAVAACAAAESPLVLKHVRRPEAAAENLLRPDRWRPWGAGFKREGKEFVCDNGRDASAQRGASQTVVLNQKRPVPILAAAASRAADVSGGASSDYSLYLDIIYADGTPLWGQTAAFSPGTHDWEIRKVLVVPEKPIRSVTAHLLLRRRAGQARFKDAPLLTLEPPPGCQLFDGEPVKVARVPSSGFEVRDAAADSDFVAPKNGRALGVAIQTQERAGFGGARVVDVTVRELTGRDRAISLVWARRLPEGRAVWFQDSRRETRVEPNREYTWTARFRAGANGGLSRWPFAAVGVNGRGYALGIDPTRPAFFRVGYHSGSRQLFVVWDLGFAPEKREARLRFCEFQFDAAHGFRAALDQWYRIFPDQFACRVPEQGLWMPFAPISKVEGWEDFGFKFKEGAGEVAWDDAHGILTFRYTEPMTWWMPMDPGEPRTLDAALAHARRLAAGADAGLAAKAQALWTSGMFDEAGRFACLFRNAPWCNGAIWSMNSMPGIRGEITDFKLKWNEKIARRWYGPDRRADLDGEYIDSSEGYVTAELDFRRDHFAAADTPLTFSLDGRKPAIFRGLTAFEYVRALAREMRRRGKFAMANSTPSRLCWLAPWLDVMGTETDWNPGGRWRPMSDAELLYRRALCGPKPFCFLMNTDFSRLSRDRVERYMQRAVAYGMFPGFFSANAATGHYFSQPRLYNRDRALFRKYVPICKRLAEAGWRPLVGARADVPEARVERFGDRYLTVYNDSAEPKTIRLRIQAAPAAAIRELVSGREIPCAAAAGGGLACRLRLAPGGLAVLDMGGETGGP